MAKAICNVTIAKVMDTLQGTASNRGSQRVTEKANKQANRKKVGRKERAKESPELVTTVGRKATLQSIAKAKARASNGVGKARAVGQAKEVGREKALTKLTTVMEKQKPYQKSTLVESG